MLLALIRQLATVCIVSSCSCLVAALACWWYADTLTHHSHSKSCAVGAEAGCSGNQQSDNDEPMSSGPETEHVCVLVYGGFSGDAVEGDLISIDPGECIFAVGIWCVIC